MMDLGKVSWVVTFVKDNDERHFRFPVLSLVHLNSFVQKKYGVDAAIRFRVNGEIKSLETADDLTLALRQGNVAKRYFAVEVVKRSGPSSFLNRMDSRMPMSMAGVRGACCPSFSLCCAKSQIEVLRNVSREPLLRKLVALELLRDAMGKTADSLEYIEVGRLYRELEAEAVYSKYLKLQSSSISKFASEDYQQKYREVLVAVKAVEVLRSQIRDEPILEKLINLEYLQEQAELSQLSSRRLVLLAELKKEVIADQLFKVLLKSSYENVPLKYKMQQLQSGLIDRPSVERLVEIYDLVVSQPKSEIFDIEPRSDYFNASSNDVDVDDMANLVRLSELTKVPLQTLILLRNSRA
eukprot:Platyproteum_vivax@DN6220_c0_g1_i1.p1